MAPQLWTLDRRAALTATCLLAFTTGGCESANGGGGGSPQDGEQDQPAEAPEAGNPLDRAGDAQRYMLYDLGEAPGYEPGGVHADGDGVYWAQKGGKLFWGSLDGSKEPERIGSFFSTNNGTVIRSDSRYVYWLDGTRLRLREKSGAPEKAVELDNDHTGGDVLVSESHVYVAMWGCAAIGRIEKDSWSIETIYIDVGAVGVGGTALLLDGDALYCGSWGSIFQMERWGAEPRRILDAASRITGLAATGDSIYWLDEPRFGWVERAVTVGRVPKAGGPAQIYVNGFESIGTADLVHAPAVGTVFFILGSDIAAFDLRTHEYSRVLDDWAAIGIAHHDGQLFWGWDRSHGRIQHMSVEQEPEETLKATVRDL